MVLPLLAVAVLAVWQWFDHRTQLDAVRQEVARRLAEVELRGKEGRLLADQARETGSEALVKLGVLEARLAESQSQQIALEALYQDLSRNRDEWAYAEIEQSLLIASQQLQLAGNVKAALIALQNADMRLQRMERPQLTTLRKAINRDIEQLKLLPHVDITGISVRLDHLMGAVDTLPLAMEARPPHEVQADAQVAEVLSPWQRFWREAWADLKQLVHVQHTARPEPPLLAPSQAFFLRENLKLRLIGARLALLSREDASYKGDLKAASDWLSRYFDTGDKAVVAALATLHTLHDSQIGIVLPDLSATLDALYSHRQARERLPR